MTESPCQVDTEPAMCENRLVWHDVAGRGSIGGAGGGGSSRFEEDENSGFALQYVGAGVC